MQSTSSRFAARKCTTPPFVFVLTRKDKDYVSKYNVVEAIMDTRCVSVTRLLLKCVVA